MAAPWPTASTPSHTLHGATKSFADVTAGGEAVAVPELGSLGSHRGEPALIISRQELTALAVPFRNALIGRFALRRPPMESIRKFFVSLGLKGEVSVGLLDAKHVLIRPSLEEDYSRLFIRRMWFFQNSPMAISKWSMDFKADQDYSIAPVWVTLPGLPLPFFDKRSLLKLGSLLGRPLQLDAATLQLRRLSVVQMLVEIDVSTSPVKRVWIGDADCGQWQPVEYEAWPSFCGFCRKLGHTESGCYKKFPELLPSKVKEPAKALARPRVEKGSAQSAGAVVPPMRDKKFGSGANTPAWD
ncbi:uncharacterized protein [Coffea arabica]|uniref:DUF4283 domain-containing protein n=1 Tax=Coffea arabica TaxID=13443 RepID=A0ABM4WPT8_COFAR